MKNFVKVSLFLIQFFNHIFKVREVEISVPPVNAEATVHGVAAADKSGCCKVLQLDVRVLMHCDVGGWDNYCSCS